MAAIKYSRYRLLGILFIGLLCVYAGQAFIIFYGGGVQATAAEIIFFIVGSTLCLFFDCMLPLEGKQNKVLNTNNIIYIGWFLVLVNGGMIVIDHLSLLSWLNMAIYTAYFAHLCVRIWRHKPMGPDITNVDTI